MTATLAPDETVMWGDVTKNKRGATSIERPRGGQRRNYLQFLCFSLWGEGGGEAEESSTNERRKKGEKTDPICAQKLPFKMKEWDSNVKVWISFSLLSTGVSSESQKGSEWESGLL